MNPFLKSIIRNLDIIVYLLLCVFLYILYRLLMPFCKFDVDQIHYLYPCLQSMKGILLFVFVHFGFYIGIRQERQHEYLNKCYAVANDDIVDDLTLRFKIERKIFESIADSHGVDFITNAHAEMAQFVPTNSAYVTDTMVLPREGCLRRRKQIPLKLPVSMGSLQKTSLQQKTDCAGKGLLTAADGMESVYKDTETIKKLLPAVEPVSQHKLPTSSLLK